MGKAIFYDPQRKRWRRLRLLMDVLGLTVTLLIAFFIVSALRFVDMKEPLLPQLRRPYKALKEKERRRPKPRAAGRKSKKSPGEAVLNSGEIGRAHV